MKRTRRSPSEEEHDHSERNDDVYDFAHPFFPLFLYILVIRWRLMDGEYLEPEVAVGHGVGNGSCASVNWLGLG